MKTNQAQNVTRMTALHEIQKIYKTENTFKGRKKRQ